MCPIIWQILAFTDVLETTPLILISSNRKTTPFHYETFIDDFFDGNCT